MRSERVGDQLRNILANIFISEIFIPEAGLLTITNVIMTDDLKIAKIFVSFLDNKESSENIIKIMKKKKQQIRYHVGNNIDLKYTPELRFYHDNTMENVENIGKLLNKIYKDD